MSMKHQWVMYDLVFNAMATSECFEQRREVLRRRCKSCGGANFEHCVFLPYTRCCAPWPQTWGTLYSTTFSSQWSSWCLFCPGKTAGESCLQAHKHKVEIYLAPDWELDMFSWIWAGLTGHPWIWDNQLLEWNLLLLDREQAVILLHLGQLSKNVPLWGVPLLSELKTCVYEFYFIIMLHLHECFVDVKQMGVGFHGQFC